MEDGSYLATAGDIDLKVNSQTNKGKILLNGNQQQIINNLTVCDLEVDNPKGIKCLSDFSICGYFNLKGNPFEAEDKTITVQKTGRLSAGDTYPKLIYLDENVIEDDIGCTDFAYAKQTYFNNAGQAEVGGDLIGKYASALEMPNTDSLLKVAGNIDLKNYATSHLGKVILNGNQTQMIGNFNFNDLEVVNSNGINLKDNISIYGNCNMNGNPVVTEDKSIYVYSTGTLSSGTVYPKVIYKEENRIENDLEFGNLGYEGKLPLVVDGNLKVANDFVVGGNSGSVENNGRTEIGGSLLIKSDSGMENNGQIVTGKDIVLNNNNNGYAKQTYFNNAGKVKVGGNLSGKVSGVVEMTDTNSILEVAGDIILYNNTALNAKEGTVVLSGNSLQEVNTSNFETLIIENESEEGVCFQNKINVSKLFNHNRNKFSIKKEGSSFADYDGDGILDDQDEYPLAKYGKLQSPVANIESGIYEEAISVGLSCEEIDADIYYTIDGSSPSRESDKYQDKITLNGTAGDKMTYVLRVLAIKDGMQESDVREYTYTIDMSHEIEELVPQKPSVEGSVLAKGGTTDEVFLCVWAEGEKVVMVESENGGYSISGLADGTYTMEVSKRNYATRNYEFTVSDGTADPIDVEIHLIGDIDGDGYANVKDLNRICDHIRGKKKLTDYEFACADITGDGKSVDVRDLNRICDHVRNKNLLWR